MEIINLYPGSFGSNCYCLFSGTEAAVVDPSARVSAILSALEERGARLRLILLTHGHFDHILSLDELRATMQVPVVCIHKADADLPGDATKNAFRSFFGTDRTWGAPNRLLSGGEALWLGEEAIEVLHTPGHTAGSVCYRMGDKLLTGDTLFDGGYGRYDLPGGNAHELSASLQMLRALPGSTAIYPGHGGATMLSRAFEGIPFSI